jgi:hypothetical protein
MNRRDIFKRALTAFIDRNGDNLTSSEIEPIAMNLAYLEVSQAKKSGKSINAINVLIEYVQIANETFPLLNFHSESVLFGYQATLHWDGLWEFLQNYFSSKLGWSIDVEDLITERFDSSCHTREEYGQFITKSNTKRKVELMFKEDYNIVIVRISESLSDKKAMLESANGRSKIYRGTDPDYRFTVVYDNFGTIEEFILELIPRSLKIIYHE